MSSYGRFLALVGVLCLALLVVPAWVHADEHDYPPTPPPTTVPPTTTPRPVCASFLTSIPPGGTATTVPPGATSLTLDPNDPRCRQFQHPFTGAQVTAFAALALALTSSGLVLLRAVRRRRRS